MPAIVQNPRTLYDKVLDSHIIDQNDDGTILIYIGMLAARLSERSVLLDQSLR